MSFSALRTAAKQLALWGLLLVIVALLTALFSILGTITAAVVTGVIMGAARRWNWRAMPVSGVFALAGLTMAQAARADLNPHQRLWMAGVSFAAFWGIYLLALGLMRLETNHPAAAEAHARVASARPWRCGVPPESPATAETAHPLSLRDFQGRWLCETTGPDGQANKRIMEIADHKFALRIRDASGHVHLGAEGQLKLETTVAATILSILPAAAGNLARIESALPNAPPAGGGRIADVWGGEI